MKQTSKSVIIFLEEDTSFECHVLNRKIFASQLEKYLYNNLLIGSKINSFTIDNGISFNLFNRDISYLKNIFEMIVIKYGNIDDILKYLPNCKVYKENDLKKMYNMTTVPQSYKLLNLTTGYSSSSAKYYSKFTSTTNLLITILSICAIYDLHFTLHIQLQTHLYKSVKLSFEDI
jgi:hypothetical protein